MLEKISLLLDIIGLATNFVGVVMMFRANPKVRVAIGMLPNSQDLKEISKNDKNTKLFRRGMFILSAGFVLQFIALIVSTFKVFSDAPVCCPY